MMLKLKLQYFGHLMWRVDSLEKTDAGMDWRQEEKGTTEDEMTGGHHWLDGHESEWTPGDGDGGLVCCDSWGSKESDMTEQLNWTELTRRMFVGKVMSLLLNMLSRLDITFLPRSKQGSFNFMAAITTCSDFGAQKNKVWHCLHCFPIYFPWRGHPRWLGHGGEVWQNVVH